LTSPTKRLASCGSLRWKRSPSCRGEAAFASGAGAGALCAVVEAQAASSSAAMTAVFMAAQYP